MLKTLTDREAQGLRARLRAAHGGEDLADWARPVLADIHAGVRTPDAIRHPLGFICVRLYRGPGWGVCLHIWTSPEPVLTTTAIHSHSWDLHSQVICGQLENVEIRVIDGAPEPTHRVLEITTTIDGTDVIHPTPRLVRWTPDGSSSIGAGENYSLPAGVFHLSKPGPADLTATILLAEYRQAAPELALGHLDAQGGTVTRPPCPPEDLRATAEATRRGLVAAQEVRGARCRA